MRKNYNYTIERHRTERCVWQFYAAVLLPSGQFRNAIKRTESRLLCTDAASSLGYYTSV